MACYDVQPHQQQLAKGWLTVSTTVMDTLYWMHSIVTHRETKSWIIYSRPVLRSRRRLRLAVKAWESLLAQSVRGPHQIPG